MKPSGKIANFLLLLAMGLTLLPASLIAAPGNSPPLETVPVDMPKADGCDDQACCGAPEPEDDNCCETGCQHCSLPCCSGTVMIPALAQVLDTILTVDDRLATIVPQVTWVDADPPFHPPRV